MFLGTAKVITDLKKHISNKAKVECKSEKDLDDLHKLNQKEDKEITKKEAVKKL